MYLERAISPIVATILLILISIAAGVILWLWMSGFIAQISTAQPALAERIRIEAVKVINTTHINIYVRNLGNSDVTISSAYILDIGGAVKEPLNISSTTPISISPGEVKPIPARYTGTYSPGYSYMVKVVTTNGVEAQYAFVWP